MENPKKFQKYFWREVSAVFDDPERYEHDGFYEEDTDYEDEYEADDSDYIVDDEEN